MQKLRRTFFRGTALGSVRDVGGLFAWDLDAAELPCARARLQARPEFSAAVRRLAANMLADADRDPALGDLLRDAGRTVAALSAVALAGADGLTLASLKAFIAGFGLVSPGRARALLNLMLHLKYVQPLPGVRPRRYALTPQFLSSYAAHEASLMDAAAVIEPAVRRVAQALEDPAVLHRLAAEQGAAFVAGSRLSHPFGVWFRVFMHPLAGIQMLHSLVARADSFPPMEPIAFSAAETARRFQVSRIHISRIVREAAEAGLLEIEPGALRFTEAARDGLIWIYAGRLCVHLACAARTLKAFPELGCGE